jgi:outer membrane murein-binding lipoprotein Lpp
MTDLPPSESPSELTDQISLEPSTELLDINTASQRKLLTLPGIGRAMAAHIQAARPFATLDDLLRVSGITETMIEIIKPHIVVSPLTEAFPSQEVRSTIEPEITIPEAAAVSESTVSKEELAAEPALVLPSVEAEKQPEPQAKPSKTKAPPESKAPQPTPEEKAVGTAVVPYFKIQPNYVKVEQALWMSVGSAVIAMIFALILTLGILAAINGGLHYATLAEIAPLSRDVTGIGAQANTLRQDLDGMRQRLDNLEGLSGRMTSLESANEAMRTEVEAASKQVDSMRQTVEDMSGQVGDVQRGLDAVRLQTNSFQLFLDGLKNLLSGLPQSQGQ